MPTKPEPAPARFKSPRRALLTAAIATYVIGHWVPFGSVLLYPLTLLATWVHETGHGVAALAVGGRFDRLLIFWDASGLAYTTHRPGWPAAVVALGGLLAPPITGALILLMVRGPRRATAALGALAVALLLSLALWVRSPVGFVSVPLTAALLGLVLFRFNGNRRLVVAHFIALQLAIDTLGRMLGYVFMKTATVGGEERRSDIANVADNLGGHYVLWGVAVSAVALGLLALGLWSAWREPKNRARPT